jgi:prephenate dehydrogenase
MNHKKTDSSNDTSRLRKSNTKMWHDILMRRRKKDDMLDFMKSLKYVKERFNT